MIGKDSLGIQTPLTFLILLALADANRHGYGIIKEIETRTKGKTTPSTGALYLALNRMEEKGLIETVTEPPAGPRDSRRRYYRLTRMGRQEAKGEAIRMATLVGVAQEKNLLAKERP